MRKHRRRSSERARHSERSGEKEPDYHQLGHRAAAKVGRRLCTQRAPASHPWGPPPDPRRKAQLQRASGSARGGTEPTLRDGKARTRLSRRRRSRSACTRRPPPLIARHIRERQRRINRRSRHAEPTSVVRALRDQCSGELGVGAAAGVRRTVGDARREQVGFVERDDDRNALGRGELVQRRWEAQERGARVHLAGRRQRGALGTSQSPQTGDRRLRRTDCGGAEWQAERHLGEPRAPRREARRTPPPCATAASRPRDSSRSGSESRGGGLPVKNERVPVRCES